jgi:hypothetical protein
LKIKFLKYDILSTEYEGKFYHISPYTGNLIQTTTNLFINYSVNPKVHDSIFFCNNPYLLENPENSNHELLKTVYKKIDNFHDVLIKLDNKRFLLSRLYTNIHVPLFENTYQAFLTISSIPLQREYKGKLCLQRTILAAKTSKSFVKNGVLFIGALLPTGSMHAWIIESGTQPDIEDREWIMYKPLIAFYF